MRNQRQKLAPENGVNLWRRYLERVSRVLLWGRLLYATQYPQYATIGY